MGAKRRTSSPRAARRIAAVFCVALAAVVASRRAVAQADSAAIFSHVKHAKLFPACQGCHEVERSETLYPAPEVCANCHDGSVAVAVRYARPRADSGLFFQHVMHEERSSAKLAGRAVSCVQCHNSAGDAPMIVRRLAMERCLDCHVHDPKKLAATSTRP